MKSFLLCLLLFLSTHLAEAQAGMWTWMNGCNTTGCGAIWGTQGISDTANTPCGLYVPYYFNDQQGNFWIFGGVGTDTGYYVQYYDALWRFDPVTNLWTWIKGSASGGTLPVWGTMGITAPNNTPGWRGRGSSRRST
jgi:hypothetical protein